jgi:hypothetical protein
MSNVTSTAIKSSIDIAASRTLKTFLLTGPLAGNFVFCFGLALYQGLMMAGMMGTAAKGFPPFIAFVGSIGLGGLYFLVGLVLCWPIGILPALAVGFASSEYGRRNGDVPLWLPCSVASVPGLLTLTFVEDGTIGSLGVLAILVIPAFVGWCFARGHWKGVLK